MGDDHHEAAGVVETAHLLLEPGGAGIGRERVEIAGCVCGRSGRALGETRQEAKEQKSGDSQDFLRPDVRVRDVLIFQSACSGQGSRILQMTFLT